MQTYTWTIQTIDPQRGQTDWTTTPPVLIEELEAPDASAAAEMIAAARGVRFLASARGRVAVWSGQLDHGTFPESAGEPGGCFEVTA